MFLIYAICILYCGLVVIKYFCLWLWLHLVLYGEIMSEGILSKEVLSWYQLSHADVVCFLAKELYNTILSKLQLKSETRTVWELFVFLVNVILLLFCFYTCWSFFIFITLCLLSFLNHLHTFIYMTYVLLIMLFLGNDEQVIVHDAKR